MEERRVGTKRKVRLMRARALWVCVLAGLLALAAASRPGARTVFAQSTGQPGGVPQTAAPPAADNAASGTNVPAAAPDQAAKREVDDASADPRKKRIADDTASLMKLANALKAEMDKTTPDTMSVSVIRQAEEIEKLAHKMRSK